MKFFDGWRLVVLSTVLLVWGCKDDQGDLAPPVEENKEEIAAATQLTVTGGNEKVWRFEQATLINAANPDGIDISSAFNVEDDEIIFTEGSAGGRMLQEGGSLIWRPGNKINADADTYQEALLDYYLSPETYTYQVSATDPKLIISQDGTFSLRLEDNNTLSGEIQLAGGQRLVVAMEPKTAADYPSPPASLNFTEVAPLTGWYLAQGAGMVGSSSLNALYIGHREVVENADGTNTSFEKILRYDMATGEFKESLFQKNDFVTKELQIIDNKLLVMGGQYVHTYPMDLSTPPQSVTHGLRLSRHGTTVMDNEVYVIGGDLDDVKSDKVFRWDIAQASLAEAATMPAPRVWADGEIVNNKLYVFGGQSAFSGTPAESTIFIHDFTAGTWETLNLPVAAQNTFAARHENLIYVAGQVDLGDPDGNGQWNGFQTLLGTFNTLDNTFTEVPTSLDTDPFSTIHQMAIMDNKVYVIYGQFGSDTFKLMVADLQ